jgi:hypothetical protein
LSYKNIITWLVKILIGLGCFAIIYWRLRDDLTPENLANLKITFTNSVSYALLITAVLLVPVNWGIESYKWMLITAPLEKISYKTASKSVYAALCVGNLAPGRATEFLAKILFFKFENRPTIALLHFVNGMFQLSLTILFGLTSLSLKYDTGTGFSIVQLILITSFCILLLIIFTLFVLKFDALQKWIIGLFKNRVKGETLPYTFSKSLASKLLLYSALRYFVFTAQFLLIFKLFFGGSIDLPLMASVFIYFLLTTVLPMISVIEPAIRAAIALLVFGNSGISQVSIVTIAVLVWFINIALPSLFGYFIILRERFDPGSYRHNSFKK